MWGNEAYLCGRYVSVIVMFLNKESLQTAESDEEDNEALALKRKPWGETHHFCPVALNDKGVLWPGNPETALWLVALCNYRKHRNIGDTLNLAIWRLSTKSPN